MCGSQASANVLIFGGTDYRTDERYVSFELTNRGFGERTRFWGGVNVSYTF